MSPLPYRRALVIGWGASGRAATALLRARGIDVVVYDQRSQLDTPADVKVYTGGDVPPPEAFSGIDLMLLSPGVPPRAHRRACAEHAPKAAIAGELGLALDSMGPQPTALITGTNGKSTVTALVGHLLRTAGQTPFVGGNLGEPPSALARAVFAGQTAPPSSLVLECSSYQLETLAPPPTQVAMVLNISADHLDRYDSMEHYAMTKATVFDNLEPGALALLDHEDPWTSRLRERAEDALQLVGDENFAWIEGDGPGRVLHVAGHAFDRAAFPLPGRHNAKNALFALATAMHVGVSPQRCREGLESFSGLPHRMTFVRELDGVRYYNDSKATNVASALASLGGLSERFVLIAGGLAKQGDDPEPLRELLVNRGRGLIAVGSSAERFMELAGPLPASRAETMAEAVVAARNLARAGDLVVLAPACASFDQYRSYAERGERFTAAVLDLPKRRIIQRMATDEEDVYFRQLEQDKRAERRHQMTIAAADLEEKRKIAGTVETDDLAVAARIKALGFDGESARIFDLLPLVHVAWADGKIQRSERAAILKILRARNIEPGSEAFETMETLLEEKPADSFMRESLTVLRDLTGGISDRSSEIVDLCIQVAASAGGFLGLKLGPKIGEDERKQIEEIVASLGPEAQSAFGKQLDSQ